MFDRAEKVFRFCLDCFRACFRNTFFGLITLDTFVGELTVIPTEAALGAQVLGLDLRRLLDLAVQEQLRAAFTTHSVLLCRDQQLS